ncbi:MAG: hypothetical protein ACFCUR_12955 [Rhodomicrobiaceae bacterium]
MSANFIRATIFAVATLCVALPASAYQCKNYPTQSTATYKLKVKATNRAKTNWTANVKGQLGLGWSVWDIAAAKSVNCHKAGSKWTCLASGKPCLYVVQ